MDIISIALPVRAHPWCGYLLAIGLTFMALWVRFLLGDAFAGFPFLTFTCALVLVAFFGGLGPGILAAGLSAALSLYYLVPPYGSFSLIWPSTYIGLLFFALLSGTTIALMHGMFVAHEAHLADEDALRKLTAELEQRIAERTSDLQKEIVERGEAQAQLRQMQKMESIGQLTGGIAHDFNNMLAIVIGSLDMARRRLISGDIEKVTKCIDNASEGAQRAATLTARLLAFSRQQPLAPHSIDPNKLVSGMSEMLRRTIGEHLRVETVLGAGIWHAFADEAQLESAIVNLAVNSRDAMPDGGRLTIETSNAEIDDRYARAHSEVEAGQYVLIAVSDSGTGMPPEVIERAFDPFYTTKGVGKGTGLGLSQVFGYVKQSGGHVKIYSEIDEGTTIKIYLPRHLGNHVSAASVLDEEIPAGHPDRIILVVEDEQQVRHMTVDALRELGYTVVQASDGNQALEQLVVQPRVDLLFTDIVMPEMNGRQLADRARETRPDLKILFTTGYTRNAVVHNGMLDAGVAFLPKPFTIQQLALKIHEVLQGRGTNRTRS